MNQSYIETIQVNLNQTSALFWALCHGRCYDSLEQLKTWARSSTRLNRPLFTMWLNNTEDGYCWTYPGHNNLPTELLFTSTIKLWDRTLVIWSMRYRVFRSQSTDYSRISVLNQLLLSWLFAICDSHNFEPRAKVHLNNTNLCRITVCYPNTTEDQEQRDPTKDSIWRNLIGYKTESMDASKIIVLSYLFRSQDEN